MLRLITKPDQDCCCHSKNAGHEFNLVRSFVRVRLVDTDCVYPKYAVTTTAIELNKSRMKISGDLELMTIAEYWLTVGYISPGVRQGFERTSAKIIKRNS